jgi:hypothetical protein
LPPELKIPERPPLKAGTEAGRETIPEGPRKMDTYRLPPDATKMQRFKYFSWKAVDGLVRALGVYNDDFQPPKGTGKTILLTIDPKYYCQFYPFAWCKEGGFVIPRA